MLDVAAIKIDDTIIKDVARESNSECDENMNVPQSHTSV